MPQLAKGGKWVFGWVVVGPRREIRIPPDAFAEYGFQAGEPVIFLSGSRTSRGFSIGRKARVSEAKIPLERKAIDRGTVGEGGRITLPPGTGVLPGERLLAARGSGLALGFIRQGPIFEEALKHSEIEIFSADQESRDASSARISDSGGMK